MYIFGFRDEEKKDIYRDYLTDMTESLEDLKSVILKRKSNPKIKAMVPTYTALMVGLHRGCWIVKVRFWVVMYKWLFFVWQKVQRSILIMYI